MKLFIITIILSLSAADIFIEENPENYDVDHVKNGSVENSDIFKTNFTNPAIDMANSTNPEIDVLNSTNPEIDVLNYTNPEIDMVNSTNPEAEDFANLKNANKNNSEKPAKPTGNAEKPAKPTGNAEKPAKPTANAEKPTDSAGNQEKPANPLNAETLAENGELDLEALNPTKIISIKCKPSLPSIENIDKYFSQFGCVAATSDSKSAACVYCDEQNDFNLAMEKREYKIDEQTCNLLPGPECLQSRNQKKVSAVQV